MQIITPIEMEEPIVVSVAMEPCTNMEALLPAVPTATTVSTVVMLVEIMPIVSVLAP